MESDQIQIKFKSDRTDSIIDSDSLTLTSLSCSFLVFASIPFTLASLSPVAFSFSSVPFSFLPQYSLPGYLSPAVQQDLQLIYDHRYIGDSFEIRIDMNLHAIERPSDKNSLYLGISLSLLYLSRFCLNIEKYKGHLSLRCFFSLLSLSRFLVNIEKRTSLPWHLSPQLLSRS
jgi:hypothetical protein